MLRCCTFSCTSTHRSCYAAARSLALPHIGHATLLHVLLHFHTYVILHCCTFSCTSTHTSCCCTFSCTSTHRSCYAAAPSLALPHIRHAMLLHVLLHFHTYVMQRCCMFSCTPTHRSCYAAARSLALPHIRHATSQNSLLCWWLQSLERSLQTTSARKTPQTGKTLPTIAVSLWSTWEEAHEKEFFFARNADFRQTVGLVKNTVPRQLNTHKDCRQEFRKKWKYLYAAVWRKSVKGNVLNDLGQLCVSKEKGKILWRNPRRSKLLLCVCKTVKH